MSTEKTYCIYVYTSPTQKSYVGQTCNLPGRTHYHKTMNGNLPKFYRAIKKYGYDTFTFEVLMSNLTKIQADYYENFFINTFDSIKSGYNCMGGGANGAGYRHTLKTRKKMSLDRRGVSTKPCSNEKKLKISAANTGRLIGYKHSEESRKRRSIARLLLEYTHSTETREKISKARTGIKLSQYTKNLISANSARRGKPAVNNGVPHSKIAREKMSLAKLGTKQTEQHCKARSEALKLYWQRKKGGTANDK